MRAAKRALTPKPVKQVRRAMHPVSNAEYFFERSVTTMPRLKKGSARVYRHTGRRLGTGSRLADIPRRPSTGSTNERSRKAIHEI